MVSKQQKYVGARARKKLAKQMMVAQSKKGIGKPPLGDASKGRTTGAAGPIINLIQDIMTPKDYELGSIENSIPVGGREETDTDQLSIPEEKTGTKCHSRAFPLTKNSLQKED